MVRPLEYRKVIKRLRKYDKRFEVFSRRGKGSHRMIFHPDIQGEQRSFPIKYHGKKTMLRRGYLKSMIRRFDLPKDFFS